jgi:hypothetical protein
VQRITPGSVLRRAAALTIVVGALAVAGSSSWALATPPTPTPTERAVGSSGERIAPRGRFTPLRSVPAGATVVHYGIEPVQAYDIDFDASTWSLNFTMWWRWRGDIDPVTTTVFDNASSPGSFFTMKYSYADADGRSTPTTLVTGERYQAADVQAQFTGNFRLQDYPLDAHDLEIRFQNDRYPLDLLVYLPDHGGRTAQRFLVPDWRTDAIEYGTYVNHTTTDFGDPTATGAYRRWSLGTYQIEVSRPRSHFVIGLLMPLCFVLAVVIAVLLMKAEHEASRLAIAATGLLTVIFLQQGYSNDLPPTAPVALMDKIYGLAFAVVFVVIARVIWETFQVFHHKRESHPYVRFDRSLAIALACVFAIGTALLVIAV